MSRVWALLPLLIAGRVSAQPAALEPPPAEPVAPVVVRPPSEVAPMPVRPATPPLSAGRVFGELALGAGLGAAGFFGGAMLGAGIEKANGCTGELCGLGGAIIGGYIGGSIGVGAGVSIAGGIGDETGSMAAAIGGGFIGGLVALGVGEGVGKLSHNDTLAWVVGASAWPATSVVCFSLSRRWRSGPVTTGSLLRYDHGRASLGVPVVVRSETGAAVSLASGSF